MKRMQFEEVPKSHSLIFLSVLHHGRRANSCCGFD